MKNVKVSCVAAFLYVSSITKGLSKTFKEILKYFTVLRHSLLFRLIGNPKDKIQILVQSPGFTKSILKVVIKNILSKRDVQSQLGLRNMG